MAVSPYFNHYHATNEQDLFQGFMAESIRQYGMDVYYVPRVLDNYDKLFVADNMSKYESAYLIDMYLKNIDGFSGDGNFMSKFGLEIRDQVVFQVATSTFETLVTDITGISRPREGDLVYFPLNRKVFQIKFVDKFDVFYQGGKLPSFDLTCELFEYSNEVFSTGIADLDRIQVELSTNILDYVLKDEDGVILTDEDGKYITSEKYDIEQIADDSINDTVTEKTDDFIDWDQTDPFSEFYNER